ncbi:hypothetical protein ABEB36_013525 [Hypothenemus hampei]|uniref:Leucine-rich repeat-containing protein 58 n=1 Tax=Hypothenemus hampei TaxID=57062 RepID=A0ABD1E4H2_HYPHA
MDYYYTSESSDGEPSDRTIDLAYLLHNKEKLEELFEDYIDDEKKKHLDINKVILHHNLLNVIPNNLMKFSNMKFLDLSNTGLTTFPDIFQFCKLTSLSLKNNLLQNDTLPKEFTECASLRELSLSGNNITEFPEQIFNFLNLKFIYLGGNGMRNISKDIWKLKHLQVLSIGGNKITEVPPSLGALTNLQCVVLSHNQIESLPAAIANLHSLKTLLLHKNRLRALPPEMIALKNLSELSLRDNPLVVRFVSLITHEPPSLLELSARVIKLYNIEVGRHEIPITLFHYLNSAHRCVNPYCKGVYFDNRVEHIKFVDFCGKYRIPLLQYLCSSKCATTNLEEDLRPHRSYLMQKVLLG